MSKWIDHEINERFAIIQNVSQTKGMDELAVEKDWWVVTVLCSLFNTSLAPYFRFKGGSSLVKGWPDIQLQRFSEDIDISMSRNWFTSSDEQLQKYPFAECANNNQIKLLRKAFRKVVFDQIAPELEAEIKKLGETECRVVKVTTTIKEGKEVPIDTDRDPVVINVHYPSSLGAKNEYIQPIVKIEISCLSMDEPFEQRDITSFIYDQFPEEDDETQCQIATVLPIRTFLEKSLLLNEEYQKCEPRSERMSRHLYDLEKMMDLFADNALSDDTLYNNIVSHRSKFYHISSVDYDSDYKKIIHIWPPKALEPLFANDYNSMLESFIFDSHSLSFAELKKRICILEQKFHDFAN